MALIAQRVHGRRGNPRSAAQRLRLERFLLRRFRFSVSPSEQKAAERRPRVSELLRGVRSAGLAASPLGARCGAVRVAIESGDIGSSLPMVHLPERDGEGALRDVGKASDCEVDSTGTTETSARSTAGRTCWRCFWRATRQGCAARRNLAGQ